MSFITTSLPFVFNENGGVNFLFIDSKRHFLKCITPLFVKSTRKYSLKLDLLNLQDLEGTVEGPIYIVTCIGYKIK